MCRLPLLALAALVVVSLTGCATPSSRIKKNPELFASFPVEAQAKIQRGEVDLGFTQDMVEMALGKPERLYNRKTTSGDVQVWSYVSYYTTYDHQRVNANVRVRDPNGGYRTVTDWVWVDVESRNEYERLRIEFVEGAVSAIETVER